MLEADELFMTKRKDGEGTINADGYLVTQVNGKRKLLHVRIAESVLRKSLPIGAQVHHVNSNPSDNRHSNLVICPNRAYHMLLHVRTKALEACGNPDWRPCVRCKKHDDTSALKSYINKSGAFVFYHRECENAERRMQKARGKALN